MDEPNRRPARQSLPSKRHYGRRRSAERGDGTEIMVARLQSGPLDSLALQRNVGRATLCGAAGWDSDTDGASPNQRPADGVSPSRNFGRATLCEAAGWDSVLIARLPNQRTGSPEFSPPTANFGRARSADPPGDGQRLLMEVLPNQRPARRSLAHQRQSCVATLASSREGQRYDAVAKSAAARRSLALPRV